MDIWQSLSGQVEVTLTSSQPEADLEELACLGLVMEELTKTDELTYHMRISRHGWKTLETFCHRRGACVSLRKKRGVFWKGTALLTRPVLVVWLSVLFFLSMYLPSRVLFVEVEGNIRVPSRQILEAAADCGLSFGTPRRQVRSERIKNNLLATVPQLQWAGVTTRGCVATISVRERTVEKEPVATGYSAIVAARDGFLLTTTVTQGSALCTPGQTVRAGDILISGYTDCGICVRFDGAQGEIFAQTSRRLEAVCPLNWLQKEGEGAFKRKIGVTLGKKRIIFWKDSGILEGSCGRMIWQSGLTLPGGFSLPVKLWMETYPETVLAETEAPELAGTLSEFAESYLRDQMIGGTIQSRQEHIEQDQGAIRMTGEYTCTEMIGRGSTEQVEDIHGKTS